MFDLLLRPEGTILLWVQDCLRTPALTAFFTWFTRLGDAGLLWIVLSAALLIFRPTRRSGACALLALLLGMLATNAALKHLIARPRPWLMVEGLLPLVAERDPNSFPSGHTTAAFAAGVVWLKTLPWAWGRAAALGAAVVMGLSRLYVGVHYPSDVLAGALIGTLAALAALALWNRGGRHARR